MDWFKGNFTGKPHIEWENNSGFRFRFSRENQSIDIKQLHSWDAHPISHHDKPSAGRTTSWQLRSTVAGYRLGIYRINVWWYAKVYGGFHKYHKWGYPNSWIQFIRKKGESYKTIDDLEVPPHFSTPPIYILLWSPVCQWALRGIPWMGYIFFKRRTISSTSGVWDTTFLDNPS